MKLLIKSGRVVDPANNIDAVADILVDNDKISQVQKDIAARADNVINARGKIVMPGIVDMHVHLREPGREDKETVLSGTLAAVKGGVTALLAMPNTQPAIDCGGNCELLLQIIQSTAKANVYICATLTKCRQGREITNVSDLKAAGAIALSDDGSCVEDAELFLKALKAAKQANILVISHCEDRILSGAGVVNLGIISTRLGLRGIPRESEYVMVKRDISLADKAGAKLHIAHVSCAESVEIIAAAKNKGIAVTAETAPQYFSLGEEDLHSYDTNLKMKPPLRTKADIEAIKQGLKTGVIDAIASDHAPHTENEKDIEFDRAEFGVVGLETELSAGISELVNKNVLTWPELVEKLSFNPARILGIDKGTLGAGKDADIAIVAPDKEWTVRKEELVSKSKNSAFLNRKLQGVVEYTILGGRIAYERK